MDMTKYQSGTSIPSLSQRTLDQIIFRVPPLREQKRIVEKVGQLMIICDQLEQLLRNQALIAEKFSRSVVSSSFGQE
jgi:type I restriction enzyme S subunit